MQNETRARSLMKRQRDLRVERRIRDKKKKRFWFDYHK